jgi:hypothetical protein
MKKRFKKIKDLTLVEVLDIVKICKREKHNRIISKWPVE